MALMVALHVELLGSVGDALDHVEHEELLLSEVLGGAHVDHPVEDVDEGVVVLEKREGHLNTGFSSQGKEGLSCMSSVKQ